MCNRTSFAEVYELPQSHCGDEWEGRLFSWLPIIYILLSLKENSLYFCGLGSQLKEVIKTTMHILPKRRSDKKDFPSEFLINKQLTNDDL